LAVKKEAIPPIRSGRYVTSGVTMRIRGLICECVMVSPNPDKPELKRI
jgi:hypothetical protein